MVWWLWEESGASFAAAVQDADQSVGDMSQCPAVVDVAGALFVVVGAGAG